MPNVVAIDAFMENYSIDQKRDDILAYLTYEDTLVSYVKHLSEYDFLKMYDDVECFDPHELISYLHAAYSGSILPLEDDAVVSTVESPESRVALLRTFPLAHRFRRLNFLRTAIRAVAADFGNYNRCVATLVRDKDQAARPYKSIDLLTAISYLDEYSNDEVLKSFEPPPQVETVVLSGNTVWSVLLEGAGTSIVVDESTSSTYLKIGDDRFKMNTCPVTNVPYSVFDVEALSVFLTRKCGKNTLVAPIPLDIHLMAGYVCSHYRCDFSQDFPVPTKNCVTFDSKCYSVPFSYLQMKLIDANLVRWMQTIYYERTFDQESYFEYVSMILLDARIDGELPELDDDVIASLCKAYDTHITPVSGLFSQYADLAAWTAVYLSQYEAKVDVEDVIPPLVTPDRNRGVGLLRPDLRMSVNVCTLKSLPFVYANLDDYKVSIAYLLDALPPIPSLRSIEYYGTHLDTFASIIDSVVPVEERASVIYRKGPLPTTGGDSHHYPHVVYYDESTPKGGTLAEQYFRKINYFDRSGHIYYGGCIRIYTSAKYDSTEETLSFCRMVARHLKKYKSYALIPSLDSLRGGFYVYFSGICRGPKLNYRSLYLELCEFMSAMHVFKFHALRWVRFVNSVGYCISPNVSIRRNFWQSALSIYHTRTDIVRRVSMLFDDTPFVRIGRLPKRRRKIGIQRSNYWLDL